MSVTPEHDRREYRTPYWIRLPDENDGCEQDFHVQTPRPSHVYSTGKLSAESVAVIVAEEMAERSPEDWLPCDGEYPVVIVTVGEPELVPTQRTFKPLPDEPPAGLPEFKVEIEIEINASVKPHKRPSKPEPRDPLLPEAIPHDPRHGQLAFDESPQ